MVSGKTLDPASGEYDISIHSMPNISKTKKSFSSHSRSSNCGVLDSSGEAFHEIALEASPHIDSAPVYAEKKRRAFVFCKLNSDGPAVDLLHLPETPMATCAEHSVSNIGTSAAFDLGGVAELRSFQSRSPIPKSKSGDISRSSNMSSAFSSDPCRDLELSPHAPPNPVMNQPLKKKIRFNNLLQDPFSRQMLERYQNYRPSGSQHNSEAPLDFQHPYQTVTEPEHWTKRMRSWFVHPADPVSPVQIWPPPITIAVNNNPSSSSFHLSSSEFPITIDEHAEPNYTPQGIPLGADKHAPATSHNEGLFLCCWSP